MTLPARWLGLRLTALPIVRRSLPSGVRPGLQLEAGHHRADPRDIGCNMRRRLNLHHPERVRLGYARQITAEEWRASK